MLKSGIPDMIPGRRKNYWFREASKKSYPLNGRDIKRGGKGPGHQKTKKKLKPFFPTFQNFNGH